MQSDSYGEYGGIAGRVLREAMSPGTWLTGFVLTLTIFLLAWCLDRAGAGTAATLVAPVLTAFALARFALNGVAGEWRGTLFSTRGGTWADTGLVGLRFLALSAVWLVPLIVLGWRPEQTGQAIGSMLMGMGGNKALSLTTLAGSAAALTPPILIIGAVSAERWSDLLSRSRWMRLFEGRLGDLFLIYVIYLGGLAMTMAVLFPLLTAVLFQSTDAAMVFGLAGLAYACGLAVTLLGRLCGFFAVTCLGPLETVLEDTPEPLPVMPISMVPRTEANTPGSGIETIGELAKDQATEPARTEASAPAPRAPSTAGSLQVVRGTARPPSDIKAPLLNAGDQVGAALKQCRYDPEGALGALQKLRTDHQPNPRVLHALCVVLAQMGRRPESLDIAREAIPLCMERGAIRPAAEIYALHLDQAASFDLPSGQALEFADVLRTNRRLSQAEAVYRSLLDTDPDTGHVVKGLLRVADGYLHKSVDYEHARALFDFLIGHCGESPLAIHMREGLAEAERRLGQAS